jgi:hypothetical protein
MVTNRIPQSTGPPASKKLRMAIKILLKIVARIMTTTLRITVLS